VKVETLRLPAIACALAIPLCALAIRPFVEMGVNDDWSYIKTVQVLAQTGHVVYNGWATAMLGWQLYLGAFFVKLFGFSFTAVRASMLLIAMATAFLTQRTMVRSGVNDWNATLGTLVIVTSPVFIPLTFSFMTDVTGLFCIVLCLYACLRALQAETDQAAFAWICFAAVSNTIGGTARQIAWLGVLVMVPSTLWLLRRRRHFLLAGSLLYLGCVVFIFSAMHWFHQQPYSVPDSTIEGRITATELGNLVHYMRATLRETMFLLLPILLVFIPAVPIRNRRTQKLLVAGVALCAALWVGQILRHKLWLVPYLGNYVTIFGILKDSSQHGADPVVLSFSVQLLLTALLDVASICFFVVLLARKKKQVSDPALPSQISWYTLGVLLVPSTLAYLVLLMPRAAFMVIYDRYLLCIMLPALIPILRYYQENVRSLLPRATLLPIAAFAAFSIAGTHDCFATYRARLTAFNELRAAGIPPSAIDGDLEYNGWNQIELGRFVDDPRIPLRSGDRLPSSHHSFGVCDPLFYEFFSAISPRYSLARDPKECLGPTGFAPVRYTTWLGTHSNELYIVKVGPLPPGQSSNYFPPRDHLTNNRRYP
jgi:Dolichyl-phosphate-mannose-protein mannosyltransferase